MFNVTIKEMVPDIKDQVLNILKKKIVEQEEFKILMRLKVNKSEFEVVNAQKASRFELK